MLRFAFRYFYSQIDEIKNDTALRLYGAFVAFGYFLCYTVWDGKRTALELADPAQAYCWPFFLNCYEHRYLNAAQVEQIILFYGLACVVGVLLFLSRKTTSAAYWWLVGITILKTLIYVQDYRLRMNQHYMLYWVTLAYLFFPYKRQMLRYLLVFFYFWASVLKYNVEWMSGKALYAKPFLVPWRLVPASCVYAALLETFISWGTLSANRWIYWFALSQLWLFHIASWNVVGPFYPMLMFGLLMIFPLTYFTPPAPSEPKSLWAALVKGKQQPVIYIFLGVFSIFQLVPIVIPGDEKITGEGRLFALHMFDARVKCQGAVTVKFKDGRTEVIEIPVKHTARIQCDPVVNLTIAKRTCYLNRDNPDFRNVDLYYEARRAHEKVMRPLVDIPDVCDKDISYRLLGTNDWIKRY